MSQSALVARLLSELAAARAAVAASYQRLWSTAEQSSAGGTPEDRPADDADDDAAQER
jgi:hypothetical protein